MLQELQKFAKSAPNAEALMDHIAKRLHEKLTRYNWVGFYLVDPADPNYLVVGPFAGSFTPNQRFPLQVGLCGAAATSGKVVVVQGVTKDSRYLSGPTMAILWRQTVFEREVGAAGHRADAQVSDVARVHV